MNYDFEPSFSDNSERKNTHTVSLTDGLVTVEGKAGGRAVKFTGNIKDCAIKVERNYQDITSDYSGSSIYHLLSDEHYFLEFNTNPEGYAYKVEIEQKYAYHAVTLEAADSSLPALEKARVSAGAPESASLSIEPRDPSQIALDPKVLVTFEWRVNV